ncbi:MAG: trypsin-like peptidase domain-containing protein [Anaerolineales bacterium]
MIKTHPKNRNRIWLAIVVLVLAGLACNLGSSPEITPTPVPPAEPSPAESTSAPALPTQDTSSQDTPTQAVPSQDTPPQPTGQGLTGAQRQRLASATVLIIMATNDGGRLVPFGIGSGTLISADGLSLTTAHVASPAAQGNPKMEPDALIVALNEEEDRPPAPTYIAELRAVDGFLDLAVIQISATLDGARVNPSNLNIDYVDLGDSDNMHLGDTVNIFGFPGIGGDTITFTKGSVSGFSSQDAIGDRAWIKTDATIAGGNSGGLGANDFGQIIGVPTRGGAGTDSSITDCRVVQDTNGDGRLDENDNCIPIGGFINSLRPVNFAKPLIRAAQTGVAYESPYQQSSVGGDTPSSGEERFSLVAWSEEFDDESCPITPVQAFPSGVTQISAIFDFSGMTDGQSFGLYWLLDGEKVVEDQFAWNNGNTDNCFAFYVHNGGDPLPDGEFTLLLYAGEGLPLVAEVVTTVGGSGQPQQPQSGSGPVVVSGQITDGDTGKGIPSAVVIVLKPGIDISDWLANGTDDDVFTWTETGADGSFALPEPLQRGIEYPAIAGAEGYQPSRGSLLFDDSDPGTIVLNIELTQ